MGHPVVTFAHSTPFPTHLPQQLAHIRARFLIGASSAPSLPSRSRKSLLPRTVIIGYCDSFITQLFNQKHCKMSEYCDKSVIVTLLSSPNHNIRSSLYSHRSIGLPHCSPLLLQPRSPKMDCRIDPNERGESGEEKGRYTYDVRKVFGHPLPPFVRNLCTPNSA